VRASVRKGCTNSRLCKCCRREHVFPESLRQTFRPSDRQTWRIRNKLARAGLRCTQSRTTAIKQKLEDLYSPEVAAAAAAHPLPDTYPKIRIQRSPYVACKSQSSRVGFGLGLVGSGWVPQLSSPLSFCLPPPATKDVANRKFANQKRKRQDLL